MANDTDKLLAKAQFDALRDQPPSRWNQDEVAEFHRIVSALEQAFGKDLTPFRVPDTELKPRVSSIFPGGVSGHFGPQKHYSPGLFCNEDAMRRRLAGIHSVLKGLEEIAQNPQTASGAPGVGTRSSPRVIMGTSHPVTVINAPGTQQEMRWDTTMGGDFDSTALFQAVDRVMTGDEIHCQIFDEPRIIQRVKPILRSGQVVCFEATMIPRSKWSGLHSASGPINRIQSSVYSKIMYHASTPAVRVHSAREQTELGPDWSENYIFQPYPRWRYHWTKNALIVKNLEEELTIGGGWGDTPSDFAPYKGPRPSRSEQQDPCKWVDSWNVPGLMEDYRRKIKAQLLRADSSYWKAPDAELADTTSMKLAFGGVAKVLFESGILTEQFMATELPSLIWEVAIAGGWYRYASSSPSSIFPDQIGPYWVWRDESRDWKSLFRAEEALWRAALLEAPEVGRDVVQSAQLKTEPTHPITDAPPTIAPKAAVGRAEEEAIRERAVRRQAVVMPILEAKRWTRGRLVTEAGLGKNSVYEYLDGTRSKITAENRLAIAQALDLNPEELPE